jgi:hypothetical protein
MIICIINGNYQSVGGMCETFWETSPAVSIGSNGLLKILGPCKTAAGTMVTHAPCLLTSKKTVQLSGLLAQTGKTRR